MESSAPETTTQKPAGRKIRPEAAEGESRRWSIAVNGKQKPVWEMLNSERALAALELQDLRNQHLQELTKVFDPKDARKFLDLAEQESENAIETARKMHEALPPDKRAIVDDILKRGGTVAASELRTINEKLDQVQEANSPEELVDVLRYAFTELGNHPRPHTMGLQQLGALMQLRAGYQLAGSNKWDITYISDEIVSSAGRRLPDTDLSSAFERFFKPGAEEIRAMGKFVDSLSESVKEWWKKNRPQTPKASTAASKRDLGHDGHSA